jgi:diguanylate cyclase (GGDEF)-like protein
VLSNWWVESLTGASRPETLQALLELERNIDAISEINAHSVLDALSQIYEQQGDTTAALRYARRSLHRKENYWKETARAQSHLAAKKHQLDVAERAAARERKQSEETSMLLQEMVSLNSENELLVERLKVQSAILEQQATEDPLTKIWNRRYFDEQLARELARSGRFERPISIGLADIDNFKQINDRFSHQIGDAVLQTVATLLRFGVRETDVIARYGGEEFALLFPEADRNAAVLLAERLRMKVERFPWSAIAPELTVTLSIGMYTGDGSESASRLLTAADAQLYVAKHGGKNQVRSAAVE